MDRGRAPNGIGHLMILTWFDKFKWLTPNARGIFWHVFKSSNYIIAQKLFLVTIRHITNEDRVLSTFY